MRSGESSVATQMRLEPLPATRSSARRDDIQGLRAIAVLAVISFHAGLGVSGGFVGVDMFFVISGYVITLMLAREWAAHGRIRFARFYARRFKRLTPALALMVSATTLASALLLSPLGPQESVGKTALGAVFLAANVVIARTTGGYFDEAAEFNPLLHTWSLSVEEQFYLVFPALLAVSWFLARAGGWRRHAASMLVGIAGLVSLTLAVLGSLDSSLPLIPDVAVGFYGPATRAWEFAVGALLALAPAALGTRVGSWPVTGALGVAGVLASLWMIGPETPFPGIWTLLPVASTGLLILAGGARGGLLPRALGSRPMVVLGDLSYSMYLWHWPFIVFATLLWPDVPGVAAIAAVVSLIPAWASYYLFEQPIRAWEFSRRGFLLLIAGVVVPPVVLGTALLTASANAYWHPVVRQYQTGLESHLGAAEGCTRSAWRKADECTWNGDASGAPIYMVGDSNADHFTEAVVGAGESLGRPVVGLTEDGCSYTHRTRPVTKEDPWSSRCAPYTSDTERYLQTARVGLVLVANSYAATPLGSTEEEELRRGFSSAVRELQRQGHQVVIVQPVPHWGTKKESLSWRSCSLLRMLGNDCARTMDLAEALANGLEGHAAVLQSVAAETDVGLLDVTSSVCPDGVCESITAEGVIRYRDGTHISVPQSEELTGPFTAALSRYSTVP